MTFSLIVMIIKLTKVKQRILIVQLLLLIEKLLKLKGELHQLDLVNLVKNLQHQASNWLEVLFQAWETASLLEAYSELQTQSQLEVSSVTVVQLLLLLMEN